MLEIVKNHWPFGYYVVDNENIVFITNESHYLYNSITGEVRTLPQLNELSSPELSWGFLPSFSPNPKSVLLAASGHLYLYNLVTNESELVYRTKNYQPQAFDYVDNWVIDKNNTLWLAVSGEGIIGAGCTEYHAVQPAGYGL